MTANYPAIQKKTYILMSVALVACILLTVFLDLLESALQDHSAFYPSESFLFSSFWWLFVPLVYAQFVFAKVHKNRMASTLFTLVPISVHLFLYPALVWLLSALFYQHTFSYRQTFNYGFTKYGFILFIVYPALFVLFRIFGHKSAAEPEIPFSSDASKPSDLITSLIITDVNKKIVIQTKDILYLSASPPYTYIHHKTKRYLHNETLRSILQKLDNETFVRIHKSSIVNISKVRSYKSRLNGDYDLTIIDGITLRLSRTYAASFKEKFLSSHRDTTD